MKGDFIGFSFDGIHSSRLNIVRVSDGDRYDEELFPEINDKTTEIPGNDGEYFFWSNFGKRTFSISIAYDSVTEEQFRQIRRVFGQKRICELIFDERPYKVYYAKVEDPIELNYICFDEEEYYWDSENHIGYIEGSIDHKVYTGKTRRIYKGEGKIDFVCYYPFAKQQFKTLDFYLRRNTVGSALVGIATVGTGDGVAAESGNVITTYPNVDEWKESSGLLTQERYDFYEIDRVRTPEITNNYNFEIRVYNPGDIQTGFYLYIPYKVTRDGNNNITSKTISPPTGKNYIIVNGDTGTLVFKPITAETNTAADNETGIVINTVNGLVEGVTYNEAVDIYNNRITGWTTTGNLYNKYIKGGVFPKIKKTDIFFDKENLYQTISICCEETSGAHMTIHYDYLYF